MLFLMRPVRWFLTRSLTRYRNVDVVFCVAGASANTIRDWFATYECSIFVYAMHRKASYICIFFFLTSFKRDFILTVISFVVYARYAHTFTTDLMAFRSVAVACFAVPSYCCVYNVFFPSFFVFFMH